MRTGRRRQLPSNTVDQIEILIHAKCVLRKQRPDLNPAAELRQLGNRDGKRISLKEALQAGSLRDNAGQT